jgi:2',3'-cyclic-nucleotide 2'-phosphodiesterase (5'-nucleotidase family)
MMKRLGYIICALYCVAACQLETKHPSSDYSSRQSIDSTLQFNSDAEKLISSYKQQLDVEMNKVIGYADTILSNEGKFGESSLGNFVADLMLYQARKRYKDTVHFALINARGGLRVPINQGDITVGDIFELMPFDNEMLIIKIKGDELFNVFHHSAKKGVNVFAPASFIVRNNMADSIRLDSTFIQVDSIYNVAISDYLANGGGGFDFLMDNPQTELNIMLRDMILLHIKELTKQRKKVYARRDGRIKYMD